MQCFDDFGSRAAALRLVVMRTMCWLVVLLLAVTGCATPAASPTIAANTAAAAQPGNETAPQPAAAAGAKLAAFMVIPLTDVRTGEWFTLADFSGKVAIVEGMAVW